jgi:aspartyl-tRNA(Asn)/glutamyl-tRNA(Gln) amidotransferase subunit B
MRSKEHAHDYRYFPDPDLVPLVVTDQWLDRVKQDLPELPEARRSRFVGQLQLNPEHAAVLTDTRDVADYFEAVADISGDPRAAANWVMGEPLRMANDRKCRLSQLALTPQRLGMILKMVSEATISTQAGKKVARAVEEDGMEPQAAVEKLGLKQISDSGALEKIIEEIIAANPAEAERLKGGDKKLTGFFVGQAMKATRGKGNPREINRILSEKLAG